MRAVAKNVVAVGALMIYIYIELTYIERDIYIYRNICRKCKCKSQHLAGRKSSSLLLVCRRSPFSSATPPVCKLDECVVMSMC